MPRVQPVILKSSKRNSKPPLAADADLVTINRTDFAAILLLAEALLWSELASFDRTIYELDANWNPTGFTLPPGKYPFIPKALVDRWYEEDDDSLSVALFEMSLPDAAFKKLRAGIFPPEFGGRMMIRVQQGFVLLIGAGAARTVKSFPASRARQGEAIAK
jgi:hypothetical protein